MFENIDFLAGDVRWMDNELQEDMLQVNYPNNYILDMGWYSGKFIILIIRDFDWKVPVVRYMADTPQDAAKMLLQAIDKIAMLAEKDKSYYGELWTTEEITL